MKAEIVEWEDRRGFLIELKPETIQEACTLVSFGLNCKARSERHEVFVVGDTFGMMMFFDSRKDYQTDIKR